MQTQEVAIRQGRIDITLQADAEMLDEVIVVAYGTAKRSAFTGSASTIKSEKLEDRVVSNVTNALAGQVAGVQVTNSNGAPGESSTINIRGIGSMSASNAPLYVVDGVPFDGSISSINPTDIESMTVLKDAAANSIYGARGANGVILITTKSGQTGEAKITVDAKWGSNKRAVPNYDVIKSPAAYYETMYKALYNSQIHNGSSAAAAYQYADRTLFDVRNGGLGYQVYTIPQNEKFIGTNFKLNPNATLGFSDNEYYYTPDDWYDEIFGNSNLRQEYNVTVSGKSDKLNYYASVGYLDDSGIINNSGFTRYTGRGRADYQAKSWLKVGTNMSYSQSTTRQNGSTDWGSSGNLFQLTNLMGPIYPMYVRDKDGNIMSQPETGGVLYDNGSNSTNFQRPFMSPSSAAAGIDNDRRNDIYSIFSGRWYANITPVEGLTLTANISVNEANRRRNILYSRWGSSNDTGDGRVVVDHYRLNAVNTQYLANYIHTFADVHNVEVLAGYEQYRLKMQYLGGSNDHLYNPFVGELNNAGGFSNRSLESYTDNYMTEGILSRVQYNYDNKYFISGSFRRDASSRFHKDNRWGNFGSVGGAWLISGEDFMSNVSWVDMLKFKASWGIQGNDFLTYTSGYQNYYPYMDQFNVSYSEETGEYSKTLTYKGNRDITWESSYAFNTGFDFELFKNRLSGTVEFFNRKTVDLLYNQPTPLSSGIAIGVIPTNVGTIVNRGLEMDLSAIIIKNRNLEWTANFNITYYKNKITDLADDVRETGIRTGSRIYRIGGSLRQSYLKSYAGVDQETGQALYYVDPDNGDYTTTTNYANAQQADQGSTLAKAYGGFGTTLNFYGFDFSVQMSYQLGGRVYDGTYQALMHTGYSSMAGQNWSTDIYDAWTPENRNSNIPRLNANDNSYQQDSSRFLVSSDYLSFNNVTLGYTLPKRWLKVLDISSLRIYVTGDNLGIISARKGLDPRMYLGSGSSTTAGSFTYSAMRNISGGLTLTF